MDCQQCGTINRDKARFCKNCGTALITTAKPADQLPLLGDLKGLKDIREELTNCVSMIRQMKNEGNSVRMNFNFIICGNSGTAKTLIANIFFQALKDLNYLKKPSSQTVDASEFINYDAQKVQNLLTNARGGMVILDNAQNLIINGEEVNALKYLLVEMDRSPDDPVVILTGTPFKLREYLKKTENSNFTGRFRKIFYVDFYCPETLYEIIANRLSQKYGLTLSEKAKERLLMRCDYLSRKVRDPESDLSAQNGYLALKEADAIVQNYYLQSHKPDEDVGPEDIKGEIFKRKTADEILKKLDGLIGMDSIKRDIRSLYNQMKLEPDSKPVLHAVITGNPGTGKTTVARMLGEIYASLGVLPVGHVVEVDREKMVAGWLGQTAIKVNQVMDTAMGGVLFVDEAYSLKQQDPDPYGQEAVDTFMKRVEDDRDKFCCIVAGYKDKMKTFFTSNDGLEKRFPKKFHLEDYNEDELFRIFQIMMKKENYTLTPEAEQKVKDHLKDKVLRKTRKFANGRVPRELLAASKLRLSDRLAEKKDLTPGEQKLLTAEDIQPPREEAAVTLDQAMAKLNSLIGLKNVKKEIKTLKAVLEVDKDRGVIKPMSEHFLFTGNPGTGKTTVASIFADLLYTLEIIPTNELVAVKPSEMRGRVNDFVEKAMGGILFIDEAYNLYNGSGSGSGDSTITDLLERLDKDRGKFVCIAAGYSKEMHDFIQSNPGLASRFTTEIHFEDYDADEMSAIFQSMARKEGYTLDKAAAERTGQLFKNIVARKTADFGNARTARNILKETIKRHAIRIQELKTSQKGKKNMDINALQAEDIFPKEAIPEDRKAKALDRLEKQIGLKMVKDKVKAIMNRLEMQKRRGREKPLELHFRFQGSPGTGKTTVARLLAEVFYAIGVLPTDKLIEARSSDFIAEYKGQTVPLTNKTIDRAMGGVLFIDEAYKLDDDSPGSFAKEAVAELIKRMEDDRGKFIVIAAGYEKEMNHFMTLNSGLESRFSDTLVFEDYTPAELAQIYKLFADKDGYALSKGLLQKVEDHFKNVCARKPAHFGNGREVRQYYNECLDRQSTRLLEKESSATDTIITEKQSNTITAEDLPRNGGAQ